MINGVDLARFGGTQLGGFERVMKNGLFLEGREGRKKMKEKSNL